MPTFYPTPPRTPLRKKKSNAKRGTKRKRSGRSRPKGRPPKRSNWKVTRTFRGLQGKPVRSGNSHWLSIGAAMRKRGRPFVHKLSTVLAPSFANISGSLSCASTAEGGQGATIIADAYTPYDLIQYHGVPAGGSVTAISNNATRVILESCTQKIFFTNNNNYSVFVDVYDCVCKRDYTANATLLSLWPTGNTDEGAATASSVLGATPFQSEAFTSYVKVLKVTRINMAHSETAEHVKHIQPMKNFQMEAAAQNAAFSHQGAGGIKGLTHFSFIVYWGAAYNVQGDLGVAANTTTPATQLDICFTKQYRFCPVQQNSTTIGLSNAMPTGQALKIYDITQTEAAVAGA